MTKILSIIIPVFNEEKTIGQLLKKVAKVSLPQGIKKEIIIVDDGSTDATASEMFHKKLPSAGRNFKIFRHEKNLGKGAAVRTGLNHATGDFVIIQDGDLEYDPEDYNKLLQPILKNQAKIVFGTRLVNYPLKLWGKNKTVLPLHLVANRFLTSLVNFLFGSDLTDMETCYKLFARETVNKLKLQSDRFEIEPEITVKLLKLGYHIVEVPIKTKPRGYEQGKKIGFGDGLKAILTILKYKFFDNEN
ncbi:glycosyltransferase family 2 protein [Candidatus Daviesbacteria bacterium]|nr:glycosyltransferase family 2 protein [Candidatus Daviesbacteria bacterium]